MTTFTESNNMKKPLHLLIACLAAACLLSPALAQDKKPAEELIKYTIPLDSCIKPPVPEKRATVAQQKQFAADMDTYRSCLSSYTSDLRRYAEAHNRAATAYINAANMAVEEYNAYIKSVSDGGEEKKKP
jgi:hypothetical protein